MGIGAIIGRIFVASVCAAVIGLEREAAQKDAGFRTHILVGIGSAIFTLVSIDGFGAGDPSRVAAQVVTGIGFLGAGAIFKEGATVKGLTTAAAGFSQRRRHGRTVVASLLDPSRSSLSGV